MESMDYGGEEEDRPTKSVKPQDENTVQNNKSNVISRYVCCERFVAPQYNSPLPNFDIPDEDNPALMNSHPNHNGSASSYGPANYNWNTSNCSRSQHKWSCGNNRNVPSCGTADHNGNVLSCGPADHNGNVPSCGPAHHNWRIQPEWQHPMVTMPAETHPSRISSNDQYSGSAVGWPSPAHSVSMYEAISAAYHHALQRAFRSPSITMPEYPTGHTDSSSTPPPLVTPSSLPQYGMLYKPQTTYSALVSFSLDIWASIQVLMSLIKSKIWPAGPRLWSKEERSASICSDRSVTSTSSSDDSGSSSTSSMSSLLTASRQKKLILFMLAMVELNSYMCISLMAPFFPQEAKDKNVSSTIYGWIFGIFPLAQCLVSPCFGKVVTWVGPLFTLLAGQLCAGACSAIFGMLEFVPVQPTNTIFIALCFLPRISMAIGCSASSVASFAIIAYEFPDSSTIVFGILEIATGLGSMLGPVVGGLLYEVGGFCLPFLVLGGLILLTIPFMYLLPPISSEEDDEDKVCVGLLMILRIPAVLVVCVSVFVGSLSWSILYPTLAIHLDRDDVSLLLCGGFCMCCCAFLLLGPSPIWQLQEHNLLWLNLVALTILGAAISVVVITTFAKILDASVKAGIEDSLDMHGIVAGIYGSMYALGDFAGPTLVGVLAENIGFPWTVTYTAGICLVMSIVTFLLWVYEQNWGPTQSMCKGQDNWTKCQGNTSGQNVKANENTPLVGHTSGKK